MQRYEQGLTIPPVGSSGGVLPSHALALEGIAQLKAELMRPHILQLEEGILAVEKGRKKVF
jgi:hypothetical protein